MTLIQTLGCAVITAVAVMFIRSVRPELAPAAAALGGCMLLVSVATALTPFVEALGDIAGITGTGSLLAVMAKALSAAISCEMCSNICRDCGEMGMASKVELLGKVYIMLLSLPLLKSLISLTGELLG